MFTNFKIWPAKDTKGAIRARGRVTVSDAVNINFSIMQGQNGLFVSLPSHKGKDKDGKDKWYPDVFIEDKAVFQDLTTKAVAAYEAAGSSLNQGEAPGPTSQDTGDNIPF